MRSWPGSARSSSTCKPQMRSWRMPTTGIRSLSKRCRNSSVTASLAQIAKPHFVNARISGGCLSLASSCIVFLLDFLSARRAFERSRVGPVWYYPSKEALPSGPMQSTRLSFSAKPHRRCWRTDRREHRAPARVPQRKQKCDRHRAYSRSLRHGPR